MNDKALTETTETHIDTPLTHESLVFDAQRLGAMQRMADVMASAKVTVPAHLKGSPGDCLAIIMQSAQWGMNPYAVAQKTHLINGALGYEAQLVNAVICSSNAIQGRFEYEFEGDWSKIDGKKSVSNEHAVIACAKLSGEKGLRCLRVSMAQVGNVRNSPLWASDPRQQLAYTAVKKWARLYAPDAILGVYSKEDLEDVGEKDMGIAQVIVEHTSKTRTEQAREHLANVKNAIKQNVDSEVLQETTYTINQINEAIDSSESMEELGIAGEFADTLIEDKDKASARRRWKAKLEQLKAKEVIEKNTAQPTTTNT